MAILERFRDVVAAAGPWQVAFTSAWASAVALRAREAKVLVFYPREALASDRFARWLAVVRKAGLDEACVCRTDGDIAPAERQGLTERAEVVLMTPEVCRACMMRDAGTASIDRFVTVSHGV